MEDFVTACQYAALFAMISYKLSHEDPARYLDSFSHLCTLASPQSYCLAVLLEFRNELITLLDHIIVLLVLVIRTVGLDDALSSHSVDGAWDSLSRNELCKVTKSTLAGSVKRMTWGSIPV